MTKDVVTLHIYTNHGTYSIPNVDLEKCKDAFTRSTKVMNITNESSSLFFIERSEVTLVEAARPTKLASFKTGESMESVVVSSIDDKPPIETVWSR